MNEIQNFVSNIRNKKAKEQQDSKRRSTEMIASGALLIPWLVFLFANLVLIFGEYRVWHYINGLTNRPELAFGTLAATGLGAEIWFVAWKYPLATKWQKNLSIMMMMANFGVATFIGFGDFFVDGNGTSYGADIQTIIMMIAVVLLLDIVVGIIYFLIDKQVERDRIRSEAQADLMDQRNTADLIGRMLENAENVLSKMDVLYARYGEKNVEEIMQLLAGETGEDKKIASNLRQQQFQKPVTMYNTEAVVKPVTDGHPNPNGRHENQSDRRPQSSQ